MCLLIFCPHFICFIENRDWTNRKKIPFDIRSVITIYDFDFDFHFHFRSRFSNLQSVIVCVVGFFFYFSFCLCFFPVSLHCINSSRGKNNRGCSLWEKEKEEQQKIASHSNTMRTRQPRVNKKNNMSISRIWFADKNGWKRSETVQKPGQYPWFIDFSSFEMAFFISDFGIEMMQLLWK